MSVYVCAYVTRFLCLWFYVPNKVIWLKPFWNTHNTSRSVMPQNWLQNARTWPLQSSLLFSPCKVVYSSLQKIPFQWIPPNKMNKVQECLNNAHVSEIIIESFGRRKSATWLVICHKSFIFMKLKTRPIYTVLLMIV